MLHATANTPVLEGPGDQHEVIAFLEVNQVARIIGVSPDNDGGQSIYPTFQQDAGGYMRRSHSRNTTNVRCLFQKPRRLPIWLLQEAELQ